MDEILDLIKLVSEGFESGVLRSLFVRCTCYVHACVRCASIRICPAITCTFMHGFQNYFAKLFSLMRKSAI